REAARAQRELGALDRLGIVAPRQELPPLRDLDQLDAVVRGGERVPQLGERGVDGGLFRRRLEGAEFLDRQRARRGEQRRLKQLREGTHGGAGSGCTRPPGARSRTYACVT